RSVARAAAVPLLAVALGACGSGGGPREKLGASESEYHITLDRTTVPAGAVRVNVHNRGKSVHELVVVRTDLVEDALPTNAGNVDEAGAGLNKLSPEVDAVAPGARESYTLHLAPGRLVLARHPS